MLTTLAQVGQKTWFMPVGGSTFASDLDWTYYAIYYISVFFFILIGLCMFIFAWRYRQTDRGKVAHGTHHNNALEITWSVIPLIIVMAIFIWGFRGFLDMTTPPGEAYEITVIGKKWTWEFQYPEGRVSSLLHVPADVPVHLVLQSPDVIHSFFVPAFRIKKDVVPGRYNKTWFQATWDQNLAMNHEIPLGGDAVERVENVILYDLYCAEYCGTQHSQMITKVVVHEASDFAEWVTSGEPEGTPVERGQHIFATRGCAGCHTPDGGQSTGPTFRNLFGHDVMLADGSTQTADEQYIRQSILNPGAQIVQGFDNVMPRQSLTEAEIGWVIAWIKSLSDSYMESHTLEQINQAHGDEEPQAE